jgi:hypothetical protein
VGMVAGPAATPTPTHLAALPPLLAYAQEPGLERRLDRPKRGVPTLMLALAWLILARLGSGRPFHLDPSCGRCARRSRGGFRGRWRCARRRRARS